MGQIVSELQDLSYLNWAKSRQSSGTAGSFLKSYDDSGERKIYYKLSDYRTGEGIIGHECINEIVADRLLELLGIPHLSYRLIHARIQLEGKNCETWLNASYDFKEPGESKMALDTYYELAHNDAETPLEFCVRNGWSERIWHMLVVDYLLLNRDRHGANMEVLRNPRSHTLRLAPLFDHGLTLLCRCHTPQSITAFDPMTDQAVQSFVGSSSVEKNLKLIPTDEFPELKHISEVDVYGLFEGLDEMMPPEWRAAAQAMIWRRWQRLEAIRAAR